jgi:hypothetical protein
MPQVTQSISWQHTKATLQKEEDNYNYNSLISFTLSVNCLKAFTSPTIHPNDFPSGVE